MENGNYTLHRRVRPMLFNLEEGERRRIVEKIEQIAHLPHDEWPADLVRKVPHHEDEYVLRPDDFFRVFFKAPPGRPMEILWLTNRGALETLSGQKAW